MNGIKNRLLYLASRCDTQGWYDGTSGVPITTAQVCALYEKMLDSGVDFPPTLMPYVYPTLEGGISLEWDVCKHNISLEINLHTGQGYFHELNCSVIELPYTEDNYDLNKREEWERLVNTLTDYENDK